MKNPGADFAAVILAAGASSRFGSAKVLTTINGEILIRQLCSTCLTYGLEPIIVVLGCHIAPVLDAIGPLPIKPVINCVWQEGMNSSLQAGLAAVPTAKEGCVMILGDQPYLTLPMINRLTQTAREDGECEVVIPTFAGQRGHPVVWKKKAFNTILRMSGDEPPKKVLHLLRVANMEWDSDLITKDIDTEEDLREYNASATQQNLNRQV